MLPSAPTRLAARMLLHQLNGALSSALDRIGTQLSEDRMAEELNSLRELSRPGIDLTEPPSVLLAGRPNVGKSTLLNALLQRERVIVNPQPGTTRDVVRERISLEGVPFELMDSAGMRTGESELESHAIKRSHQLLEQCDVLLLVHDVRESPDRALDSLPFLPQGAHVLLVANKTDMTGQSPGVRTCNPGGRLCTQVRMSARDNVGTELLEEQLLRPYRTLIERVEKGAAVPFTPRIATIVERLWRRAQEAPGSAAKLLEQYRPPQSG